MNLNTEPIKNWFGFTRRERRATFILLLIIMIIIGVRYAIPDSRIAIDDLTATISAEDTHPALQKKESSIHNEHYSSYQGTSLHSKPVKREFAAKDTDTFLNNPGKGGKSKHPFNKTHRSKIDINTCDSTMLISLPGLGPVLSSRIIKYRHLLGGYARINQLKEVYGLHEDTFEMIRDRIFADSTVVTRININSAGYKEMSHFPYFQKYEITAILKFREIKGGITSISELIENKLITVETAHKVSPYLRFQ